MAVEIERDPNAAMAQALARDLRVNIGRQHVAAVRMPQIVEPNAPESKLPDLEPPFLADAAREAIEDGLLDMGMTNREFLSMARKNARQKH